MAVASWGAAPLPAGLTEFRLWALAAREVTVVLEHGNVPMRALRHAALPWPARP